MCLYVEREKRSGDQALIYHCYAYVNLVSHSYITLQLLVLYPREYQLILDQEINIPCEETTLKTAVYLKK